MSTQTVVTHTSKLGQKAQALWCVNGVDMTTESTLGGLRPDTQYQQPAFISFASNLKAEAQGGPGI